jgi:bleomycin hydrolase
MTRKASSKRKSARPAKGSLSETLLVRLRSSFEMNEADRARFNAIAHSDLNELALSHELGGKDDGHFSHRVTTKGITNQKSAGLCWLHASLNLLRPKVIKKLGLENFEFSTAYLQFWDLLEKGNRYLEDVIKLRETDPLDRNWKILNQWIAGDGGWWGFAKALIEKYGLVPDTVMPETRNNKDTRVMSKVLAELLRSKAAEILRGHDKGAMETTLRTIKEGAMEDVYRFLVLNLGEPPTEFEWRHEKETKKKGATKAKKGVKKDQLTAWKKFTPQSFFKETVGLELSDYYCLFHAPDRPFDKHYVHDGQYGTVGTDEMNFVNLEIEPIKKICLKAILSDEPIPFGVDMGIDQSTKHGLMEHKLFDYESLFGMKMELSKSERKRLCTQRAGHMMAIIGTDLKNGTPQKWLIENSWGDDKGNKGLWTLFDSWFDEHVDHVIVHKRHIPAKTLKVFREKPIRLPIWYWD